MQLKEGFLFDNRYLLKKLLGRGIFSEVWLVEDIKVGNRKMALKVFAPENGLDQEGVKLFENIPEFVSNLDQAYILHPLHFDVCQQSPYFLFPFCERGSVRNLTGNITEEDAWHILHNVAAGLVHLHEQEPPVIHRNINPDHILITGTGNFILTGIGLGAKIHNTLRENMGASKSPVSLAYTPPEQFEKNVWVKASDIWALGATLFELLTGEPPFFDQIGGRAQLIGIQMPEMIGGWSHDLKKIVTLCLQKETWNRPTAQQIVWWAEDHDEGKKLCFEKSHKDRPVKSKKPKTTSKSTYFLLYATLCILLVCAGFYVWSRFTEQEMPAVFQKTIAFIHQKIHGKPEELQNTPAKEPQNTPAEQPQNTIAEEPQKTTPTPPQKSTEQTQKTDLENALKLANQAFNSTPPKEDEALRYYKKVQQLDPKNLTGYHAFMNRAKAIISALDLTDRYDQRIKELLLKAQALQNTEEVQTELAKCP